MTAPSRPRAASAPTRHVYDVAVIGGQLSGAIAAALLARRGHHVLYVEHDGTGAGYVRDGWLLPYAPFVLPPLKALAAFEEVLSELGLTPTVQRSLKLASPMLQLIAAQTRCDLTADDQQRARELSRALGDGGGKVRSMLNDVVASAERSDAFFKEKPELHAEGLLGAWRMKRQVSKHPALLEPFDVDTSTAQGKLIDGLAAFLRHADQAQGVAASRPLSQALHGLCSWPGGREGLREVFLQRLAELGGDVLAHDASTVVESLEFEGKALTGVKLVKSDKVYRTSCAIGATDAGALRRLIPEKKKHRALTEALDAPSVKQLLFTMNWVVPERALPRGLGDLALLQPADESLSTILLQVQPAKRAPGEPPAGEDDRVVCAGTFVPASTREQGEDALRSIADRMNFELDRLMPFTRLRAHLTSAPYLDASGVRGSRLQPHPLLAFEDAPYLGVTGLNPRAPAKHLFFASREVLPGLGFEGEVLAGLRAAKLVQETLKKSDPLKKG